MNIEKHVYFVRHAESEENVTHIFRDHTVPLTENGRTQAEQVAERIAELDIDTLITSPFQRALETAQIISKHTKLPIVQSDLFGEWEIPSHYIGYHRDDPYIKAEREAVFSSLDADYRQGDEETFRELADRAARAIDFIDAQSGKNICVITHGGFLCSVVGAVVLSPTFSKEHFFGLFHHLVLGNTGITHMQYNVARRRWKFVIWNDTKHLVS